MTSCLYKTVLCEIAERLRMGDLRTDFDEWSLKTGKNILAEGQEGMERSRALVPCIAAYAFGSKWMQLESDIFQVRDELSKERRFFPLRIYEASLHQRLPGPT